MSNGTNYVKGSQVTQRYIVLLIGIFFMGTRISSITKSGTGTSPMNSFTSAMTQVCPLLILGMYTLLLNVLLFIRESIVGFKSPSAPEFIQLVPTFFLSITADFNVFLVRRLYPETYIPKLAILIIGCMFFGLSIIFMTSAGVILVPGGALTKIILVKYREEYGNIETAMDVSLVVLTVIVSLIFLNTIYDAREGTLITAFAIGDFSRFLRGYTSKLVRKAALQ